MTANNEGLYNWGCQNSTTFPKPQNLISINIFQVISVIYLFIADKSALADPFHINLIFWSTSFERSCVVGFGKYMNASFILSLTGNLVSLMHVPLQYLL